MVNRRLLLGCGLTNAKNWILLDGSWNAWLAKHSLLRKFLNAFKLIPPDSLNTPWRKDILIHDVKKPLPFTDNSLHAVYASHLLEHLYFSEAKKLLHECYRVLEPGGILRVVVPDLKFIASEYSRTGLADKFNEMLMLRNSKPPAGNLVYRIYSQLTDFHSHKWMYDTESLSLHMEETGFVNIEGKALFESAIYNIHEVENPERMQNGAGICVEGVKSKK